jgi:hypothetical protein
MHATHLDGHEKITDEFILGLAILWAYDMAVDLKHSVLSWRRSVIMGPKT